VLWARFVGHEDVRRRIWVALALALSGLALVVEIWSGIVLDGVGVAACFAAALSYALYILVAEHAVATRDPISLSCYGFFFASLFWAAVQPWWSFPDAVVTRTTSLHGHLASLHLPVWVLVAWLIVLGAIVPFALVVAALRHVSATRAGIAAMLEPPAATLVAFLWLGESLGLFQLLGGGLVLAAIGLAQSSR
jgi:drug/metabolite transporter (DMT)-like permease